jgi:RHS repeat-associated protein
MPAPRETLLCQYRYDPLDRLTDHAQPNTPTLQRFYCKSRLATEIQGTIGHSIVQHDDLLLAQLRRQDDAIDTTLLATDQQRSVLQTLEANQQRQPIAYSPYGHRPAENGLTSLLGFNGERRDPVTGHYLLGNGYRAFNPVLMRFNSPDSLSPFGKGGLNSYAYCSGDPINLTDPTGHMFKPTFTTLDKQFLFSHGLLSKKGITAEKAQAKYKKIVNILKAISGRTKHIQATTLEKDKRIALAAENSRPNSPGQLEQLAYEQLRPDFSNIFENPEVITSRFQRPHSSIIENSVKFEQASYVPLLQNLNNQGSRNIYEKLTTPSFFNTFDKKLVDSYKARIKSVTDQHVGELRNEAQRIRSKYFES